MPEEINRILTDHCSDLLFAPTEYNCRTLHREGILPEIVFVTGNTIVEALHQNLEISKNSSTILEGLGISPNEYFLVTLNKKLRVVILLKLQWSGPVNNMHNAWSDATDSLISECNISTRDGSQLPMVAIQVAKIAPRLSNSSVICVS